MSQIFLPKYLPSFPRNMTDFEIFCVQLWALLSLFRLYNYALFCETFTIFCEQSVIFVLLIHLHVLISCVLFFSYCFVILYTFIYIHVLLFHWNKCWILLHNIILKDTFISFCIMLFTFAYFCKPLHAFTYFCNFLILVHPFSSFCIYVYILFNTFTSFCILLHIFA